MQDTKTLIIETERLIIRHFTENDVEALYEILRDKEVNTFLPWFTVQTLDETAEFLEENFLKHYDRPQACRYAICMKEDNRPIGYVWLSNSDSNDFGYGLKKEFWHKGIVFEASKAVVEQIKKAGYSYITATHDVNNPRSGAVMKKLGMEYKYSYVEKCQPKDVTVTFRMYQLNFDGVNDRVYMEYWDKYKEHFVEENI